MKFVFTFLLLKKKQQVNSCLLTLKTRRSYKVLTLEKNRDIKTDGGLAEENMLLHWKEGKLKRHIKTASKIGSVVTAQPVDAWHKVVHRAALLRLQLGRRCNRLNAPCLPPLHVCDTLAPLGTREGGGFAVHCKNGHQTTTSDGNARHQRGRFKNNKMYRAFGLVSL